MDEGKGHSSREELRRIAKTLLNGEATSEDLLFAAFELHDLLSAAACDACWAPDANGRRLPTGTAISPRDAAMCTTDAPRTVAFIRGVAAAFTHVREQLPGETVEVVYAGTGPLAPLILPLLALDLLASTRITFIDINDESVRSVRMLAHRFAISGDHSFVVCDATGYKHNRPIHLAITETMQRALTVEPQVAIAMNLTRQLHDVGVMVPERVHVELCAENQRRGSVQRIATTFELSVATIRDGGLVAPLEVLMPKVEGRVLLSTSIRTFGEYCVSPGESGLTMPEYLWDLGNVKELEAVVFWYEISDRPGIRYRREAPAA